VSLSSAIAALGLASFKDLRILLGDLIMPLTAKVQKYLHASSYCEKLGFQQEVLEHFQLLLDTLLHPDGAPSEAAQDPPNRLLIYS
jgi:hypothetical protein